MNYYASISTLAKIKSDRQHIRVKHEFLLDTTATHAHTTAQVIMRLIHKHLGSYVIQALSNIANFYYAENIISSLWTVGLIITVPKPIKPLTEPSLHRPITRPCTPSE